MHRQLGRGLVMLAALAVPAAIPAQNNLPPRTFSQFAGTWVLDEAASTGRLNITPRIPSRMTIEATPLAVTVTKIPRLRPADKVPAAPVPETYRLDGMETRVTDPATGVALDRSFRFTLVADMLALTIKEGRHGEDGAFTLVTDAYAVDGDQLTLHRQLSSISPSRTVYTMTEPTNNSRHTFVYRRAP
jgi:hypothetical protein